MSNTACVSSIIALTCALVFISGCSSQAEPAEAEALPRAVVTASPVPLAEVERVQTMGRLMAAQELTLGFKAAGVVAEVLVDSGDLVSRGQLLAELDPSELDAALIRADAVLKQTERALNRAMSLHEQRLIANQALEDSRSAHDVALADERAARFNREQSSIRSPVSGRVLARHTRSQEIVAAGQPIVSVSDEDRGWLLSTTVADRDALRIETGAAVTVQFDSWPGRLFEAAVSRIAGMANPATGTFDLEIAFKHPDERFRSGLIGRASIVTAGTDGLAIPVAALVDVERGRGRIYVVEEGRARSREVQLGSLTGEYIAVTGGLSLSERVIVAGAPYVDDDQPVRLVAAREQQQ
ncbi:efflux RND transporter periplasmic adaptor subunit [Allohahella sp. A8]|uniref:efflux RND transporter periplasmic adaptor subunit n=1 Tax=Allohahella sp. A8 TaxID=3141461 RepID=UPI003A8098FC